MRLRQCPWCGKYPTKISLSEGDTHRWAICTPDCCGEVMGEIRRDTTNGYFTEFTEVDRDRAELWWNTRYDSTMTVIEE